MVRLPAHAGVDVEGAEIGKGSGSNRRQSESEFVGGDTPVTPSALRPIGLPKIGTEGVSGDAPLRGFENRTTRAAAPIANGLKALPS
jgi:hypothetical protein